MRNIKAFILCWFVCFGMFTNAADLVGDGYVQSIENGWFGEGIAFKFSKSIDGCPSEDDFYAVSKDHVAYKEIVSMLLAAYSNSSKVDLTVDKGVCLFGGRTKVISVKLFK